MTLPVGANCAEILGEGCAALGIRPDEAGIDRLCRYYLELSKWGRKINLVAAAPPREQLELHFLDSLTLWPLMAELFDYGPLCQQLVASGRLRLLDIGTGAGFPGLALKCWQPEKLQVTLVEPRLKRVSFLRQVVRSLALEGVEILCRRLEPGTRLPEHFDLITSRAFTSIAPFLEICASLSPPSSSPPGGLVVCMKGPKAQEELATWRRDQPLSPFHLLTLRSFTLPFSGAQRSLLLFARRHP